MSNCQTCNDLNKESQKVWIEDIEIETAGHYRYKKPIFHCPVCGKRLQKYEGYSLEQLENGVV